MYALKYHVHTGTLRSFNGTFPQLEVTCLGSWATGHKTIWNTLYYHGFNFCLERTTFNYCLSFSVVILASFKTDDTLQTERAPIYIFPANVFSGIRLQILTDSTLTK